MMVLFNVLKDNETHSILMLDTVCPRSSDPFYVATYGSILPGHIVYTNGVYE